MSIQINTLAQILQERSVLANAGVTFVEGSHNEEFVSYKELYGLAVSALGYLQGLGIRPGTEVVFQIEDNKSFVIAFWACVLGRMIPVPVAIGNNDEHRRKFFNIWNSLTDPCLIGSDNSLRALEAFAMGHGFGDVFRDIKDGFAHKNGLTGYHQPGQIPDAQQEDIAFVQFSSGSTGTPKGVVLTHENLLTNVKAIGTMARYSAEDTMMSWMPLTHDMGLIGFHLCPVFEGMSHFIMATNLFVRNPSLWLQKASERGASILCSPNFGYKYALRHTDPLAVEGLDLSRVRLLYNGAEPISVQLCQDFLSFFAKAGLKSSAMCPVYGLAEASLAVSVSNLEDEVMSIDVDRRALQIGDRIAPLTGSLHTVSVVNVGRPVPECSVRITDSSNKDVSGDVIGYVKIKGRNVTSGYYNDKTADVIDEEGWLDTGDVGVLHNGSLYITGRAKDIIFVNGQNYYSYDLEQVAQSLDGIELNKVAVVGYFNHENQENEAIAFVFHRGDLSRFVPLAGALKKVVNSQVGLTLSRVLPVSDIPRTTSGKLQRFKLIERYKAGLFNEIESTLHQLALEADSNAASASNASEMEEKIAAIWAKVLGNSGFTPAQNFSEVGGNSLKSAEVGMLVWKEFQVELPSEVLLEKQTIRELAGALSKLHKVEYQPIPKANEQAYYPVSASQKRLYYAWRVDKQSVAYNNPVAFAIKGQMNREALEGAMRVLIQKNDALRMSFAFTSAPVFRLQEHVDFALDRITCREGEVDSCLRCLVTPFELDKAPLYRAKVVEVASGDSILFLDFHHIIMDGVSLYNVIRDLLNVYATKTAPEKSIGYKDFICWQTQWALSGRVAPQRDLWLTHLSGNIPVLNLPYDFSRPAIFNTKGRKIEFAIDASATAGLRTLAKANACTLFVVMLAFYKLLLFKYSGQKEVVVGVPVSGRRHPDLLDLYGMFVNNIALKSSISGEEPFIQFLHTHKHNVSTALENQDYPFDDLVEALGYRSDASRNPVFDTMFVYQNMGIPEFHTEDLGLTRYFFDPGFSKFDISMEVFDAGDSLQYNIEYATGIFKEETIRSVAHHFDQLIARVLNDPQRSISDLLLISDVEYDQFIHVFNDTRIDYAQSKTVDQLFEDQVKKNPSAVAVVYGKDTITYKELDDRANQLASLLQEKGVMADTIVGILMKRSPALIVTILGILKAGGAYLPLDIDFPEDRIAHILRDSMIGILITTSDQRPGMERLNRERPQEVALTIVDFGELDFAAQRPVNKIENGDSLRRLAYVIYTSGTTGNPKGVMIEHGSIVNYVHWASGEYVAGEVGSFPLFTNTAFDLTITSILVPLATGNSIIIFEDKQELALTQVMESESVNIIKLTPSHLRILKEINTDKVTGNKRLKKFIVGGEALDTALAREIYNKFGGNVDIYNEYGPTEATIGCMIHKFDPEATAPTVPIGKPISNTQVYVLDAFLKPVPAGVEGELYISGDGLARGYLFKKELTDQQFIIHPFIRGQRMYKTGDYAKRLPDGTVEFVGRIDNQVKIRGYRVELSEIANSLKANDGIDDAIVIQKTTNQGQSVLVAYYLSDSTGPDSRLHEPALKRFLAGRLPDYMIPAHFVRLDRFPLTENGKVDHSALPEPSINPQYVAPGDRVEAALLDVWKEIFGSEDLSVADNFFDLGGDSIKAVQIASRLFEKKIEIKTRDILRYHTIEQIALQANVIGTNVYEQGILAGERGLTPIESWFFEQGFKNPDFYNQSVLLNFHKPIQVSLVNQALRILIGQHDMLRANYIPERKRCFYNNTFLGRDFAVKIVDLEATPDGLEALCYQMKRSFDITGQLLITAAVFTSKHADYLFLTAHHLVVDAFSWRILLEDFYLIYKTLEVGDSPRLPAKTASMQIWERELTAFRNATQSDSSYWDEVRRVEFVIPPDFDAGDFVAAPGRKVVRFDHERTNFLLTEGYKVYKTDVLTLLTTGLALTLKQWTGNDEYIVDFENHGRHLDEVDVSRTVGWFTSLYPVKLTLGLDSLTDQIISIKEQLRRVPHFGLGYGIQGQKPETSEIRFNYLGQFGAELNNNLFSYSDRFTGEETDPENRLTTKLDVNLMIIDGVLSLEVRYSSGSFKESTIETFCGIFLDEMARIHDHIKSEREVHFSTSDFNAVELDDDLLKSLFE